jgi:hypothetical protein
MSFSVVVLGRAAGEVQAIAAWLAERSPQGAMRWLDAFEAAKNYLAANPFACGLAPENDYVDVEVRQIVFQTRRGNRYRALFTIAENEVRILHVRGPGQPLLSADEV